jgi:hypothetical protein
MSYTIRRPGCAAWATDVPHSRAVREFRAAEQAIPGHRVYDATGMEWFPNLARTRLDPPSPKPAQWSRVPCGPFSALAINGDPGKAERTPAREWCVRQIAANPTRYQDGE